MNQVELSKPAMKVVTSITKPILRRCVDLLLTIVKKISRHKQSMPMEKVMAANAIPPLITVT